MISENTAQFGGSYMTTKWSDLISSEPEETRTAGEIKADICTKLDRLGGK